MLIERLWVTVIVVLGVSFLVFSIQHVMPGDPVKMMLMQHQAGAAPTPSGELSEEMYESMRKELGLDKPFLVQYWDFLTGLVRGDLGYSYRSGRAVADMIGENIIYTLRLAIFGVILATVMGVLAGVIAAVFQDTVVDSLVMVFAVGGVSLPSFWLSLLLILIFGMRLGWLPFMGTGTWLHDVLPVTALGIMGAGLIARLTRSSMMEVLSADYVRTARSKGLAESIVIFKHALRNAMIPVITIVGLQFGRLLAGTVIVETVFARPGIGSLMIDSIMEKDFPLTQGVVLIAALAFTLTNLLVDLTYGLIDPRISYS